MSLLDNLLAAHPPQQKPVAMRKVLLSREQLAKTHLVVGQSLDQMTRVLTSELVQQGYTKFELHYGAVNQRNVDRWIVALHGNLPAGFSTGSAVTYVMAVPVRY